ncbi:MAG: penicillin-insensitive murein endopeptidase [Proteobacteria bacterium]|nr:penicillin-insensitive murein endopeptidase [Pseudomonadota bacterium]
MLALLLLASCAELGVVGDGTSISVGKPSNGHIVDAARLPDKGEGFFTRETWRTRNNRFGTDELVDVVTAVARRMMVAEQGTPWAKVRLVVADLSGRGGGGGDAFHRSHQSGRDVDLLYYMRDPKGRPMEADLMHVFGATGKARDGSGITIDVPRMWLLVKSLLEAPEANVQWVFMYQPIANAVIEHAIALKEPEELIARARLAVKQPSDSARHDDHVHVRVFCSSADRAYGCVDIGPQDLQRPVSLGLPSDVRRSIRAGTDRIDLGRR